jgi:hypothetical protein
MTIKIVACKKQQKKAAMLKIEGISRAPVRKILSIWEGMKNFTGLPGPS